METGRKLMFKSRLKYHYIICFVIGLLFAETGLAQTQNEITFTSLIEIWNYADEHNISIAESISDIVTSMNEKKKSFSLLMPKFSLSGSYTDNTEISPTQIPAELFGGPKGSYTEVKFGQKYNFSGSLVLNADLINITSWLKIAQAELKKNLAEQSASVVKQQTYEQLASVYYFVLLYKYAVDISLENKNLADTLLLHTKQKYSEGLIDKYSLNIAEINTLKATDNLLNNKQAFSKNIYSLKSLLNIAANVSLHMTESFTDMIYKEESDLRFYTDPQIEVSALQTLIAKNSLKQVKSSWLPTLSIVGSYGYNQNSNSFEPFGNGNEWNPQQYLGLRFSFPLFTGGERWFNAKTASLQYEQAQRVEDNKLTTSKLDDQNLKNDYKISFDKMLSAKKALELAKENFEHINNKYLEGIIGFEKQSDVFTDYLNSQTYYLNSLVDYCVVLSKVSLRLLEIK